MQEGEYECLKLGAFSPNRNWFIFVESGKSCFPIAFLVQEVETFFRRDREKVNGLEIQENGRRSQNSGPNTMCLVQM